MHRSVAGARGALLVSCLLVVGCTAAPVGAVRAARPSASRGRHRAVCRRRRPRCPTPDRRPRRVPSRSPSGDPAKPAFPASMPRSSRTARTSRTRGCRCSRDAAGSRTASRSRKASASRTRSSSRSPNLTKRIEGIPTVVAYVEDWADGQLVEKEIAFYAQDDDGAVWYFGEHPEEYEDGEFVQAPTWIAGIAEAKPGIKVFADPSAQTQALLSRLGAEGRLERTTGGSMSTRTRTA